MQAVSDQQSMIGSKRTERFEKLKAEPSSDEQTTPKGDGVQQTRWKALVV